MTIIIIVFVGTHNIKHVAIMPFFKKNVINIERHGFLNYITLMIIQFLICIFIAFLIGSLAIIIGTSYLSNFINYIPGNYTITNSGNITALDLSRYYLDILTPVLIIVLTQELSKK